MKTILKHHYACLVSCFFYFNGCGPVVCLPWNSDEVDDRSHDLYVYFAYCVEMFLYSLVIL